MSVENWSENILVAELQDDPAFTDDLRQSCVSFDRDVVTTDRPVAGDTRHADGHSGPAEDVDDRDRFDLLEALGQGDQNVQDHGAAGGTG